MAVLLGAQELGLVAVIAVMVLGLWLASGTFTRSDRQPLPAGAAITDVTDTSFVVTGLPGGTAARRYVYAEGWTFREAGPGAYLLISEREVSKFLNAENLINVLTYTAFIAIMAVGMTAIIVMNGIDLSIGSIYGLSAVVASAVLAACAGGPLGGAVSIPIGVVCGVAVGSVCGAINGVGSVGLGVHPFIITLGGMAVYRGVAFIISKGETIGGLPDAYRETVRYSIDGVNFVPTLVMIVIGGLGALVLSRTVWGRRVFAIGGNETAAKYAGVPVGKIKISVFTVAGGLAGLSASLIAGHLGGASSDTGRGYELDVIAAAVVGGAALSGGRGSALGAVLGAVIIQLINNGFDLVGPRFGVDQNYRQIVIGLAIVLAVVVDQAKHRFGSRR